MLFISDVLDDNTGVIPSAPSTPSSSFFFLPKSFPIPLAINPGGVNPANVFSAPKPASPIPLSPAAAPPAIPFNLSTPSPAIPSTESLIFPRSLNGAPMMFFIILPIPLILPNKLLSSSGFSSSGPALSSSEDSPSDENDCTPVSVADTVPSAGVLADTVAADSGVDTVAADSGAFTLVTVAIIRASNSSIVSFFGAGGIIFSDGIDIASTLLSSFIFSAFSFSSFSSPPLSPPMTLMNASLGDSPPGIAALSAALDALPIRLTNPNAVLNASPIDSTIEVKNDLTLSINIPGSSVNINLIPLNIILNAATGRSKYIALNILAANVISFIGNVINNAFAKAKTALPIPATRPTKIPPSPLIAPHTMLIIPSSN